MEEKSNLNKVKEIDIYVQLQILRRNGRSDGNFTVEFGYHICICTALCSIIRVGAADPTGEIHLVSYSVGACM